MKKIKLVMSLLLVKFSPSFAQKNVANQNLQSGINTSFQNVKTQSINVGGTNFYYRKLGENNSGVPIIFLTT